jgi:formate dehydrogenase maturation protein FdhE
MTTSKLAKLFSKIGELAKTEYNHYCPVCGIREPRIIITFGDKVKWFECQTCGTLFGVQVARGADATEASQTQSAANNRRRSKKTPGAG